MSKRWRNAQRAEVDFWRKKRETILSPVYRMEIRQRAKRIEDWLNEVTKIDEASTLLEIGGGGTQLIDSFLTGNKYAIDPLADFYLKEFSEVLDPGVNWTQGNAEALPYADGFFDIIIARNVLDHVDSVEQVLSEIYRVLSNMGIVYLGLNTITGILYLFRSIKKNREHPYVFTPSQLLKCLENAGFTIIDAKLDAPENMSHFRGDPYRWRYRAILHEILLCLHCYHFSEFILGKRRET